VTKQVNATSSLLKPTAAFVAKTTANTDTFPIKSKIKVKANGVPSSKEQGNAESEKDGMSVASGVSRGSRATGIHSRASGVSLAGSSTGSSSGRSKRPTEEEIAYEEHVNVLQDKLPYPVTLPPAPYPVREIDDLDEDNEDEDRLTTGQKHLMKQLAENEARVWSNPFSSPALYSTRHVEHVLQSLSEKFVTVPTAKLEQGSADVDENKEDESDYFHREQDTENKWEDITVSTVQTTQSDRMRALQALQRHYRKHPGGHESESGDTDSSPMPVAQYLDAKDQEQLLKNYVHGKYAGNNVRKPVTGVWKKSSPVIANDYLQRKQNYALRSSDRAIFSFGEEMDKDESFSSLIRLSLYHPKETSNPSKTSATNTLNSQIMKRYRYNQQYGLYSPATENAGDLESKKQVFRWEMNLQDVFPTPDGISRIQRRRQFLESANYGGRNEEDDVSEDDYKNEEEDRLLSRDEEEIHVILHRDVQQEAAWKSLTSSTSLAASFL
jgi:hypothetical protein